MGSQFMPRADDEMLLGGTLHLLGPAGPAVGRRSPAPVRTPEVPLTRSLALVAAAALFQIAQGSRLGDRPQLGRRKR